MAGTVYTVPPIPPDGANTTYVDAGAISFGVEYRLLNDAELAANYQGAEMEQIEDALQGNAVEDNGVSIHVIAAANGHEYLRFDCFEKAPHYHYIEPSGEKQTIVEYDQIALGEMLAWAMHQLKTRLAPMLVHAGGADIVAELDMAAIKQSLVEVERIASEAEAALDSQRSR